MKSTKAIIWNTLDEKYNDEKEGADNIINFKFLELYMKNNVSIMDQVHEFLLSSVNSRN